MIQKGKEEVNTTLKNEGGEIVRGEEETGSVVVGTYAHTTVSYRSIHLSTYIILYMWESHVENEQYSTLVKNELAIANQSLPPHRAQVSVLFVACMSSYTHKSASLWDVT